MADRTAQLVGMRADRGRVRLSFSQRDARMQIADPNLPMTAIVYSDGRQFEAFLLDATAALTDAGIRLAGLVQYSQPKPDRAKCDMYLRDLATGVLHAISDDRGPLARGCVLNTDRLLHACAIAESGLSSQTDLLVLCKFGKSEAEGGGFRSLIARAFELDVLVLIGVPLVNLVPFREFSAGLAGEIELSELGPDHFTAVDHLRARIWPRRAA